MRGYISPNSFDILQDAYEREKDQKSSEKEKVTVKKMKSLPDEKTEKPKKMLSG